MGPRWQAQRRQLLAGCSAQASATPQPLAVLPVARRAQPSNPCLTWPPMPPALARQLSWARLASADNRRDLPAVTCLRGAGSARQRARQGAGIATCMGLMRGANVLWRLRGIPWRSLIASRMSQGPPPPAAAAAVQSTCSSASQQPSQQLSKMQAGAEGGNKVSPSRWVWPCGRHPRSLRRGSGSTHHLPPVAHARRLKCLEQLKDELNCAICLEVCTRPCTTACGHTFCRRCLRQALAADRQGRCPKCRAALPPCRGGCGACGGQAGARARLPISPTLRTAQVQRPVQSLAP